MSLEKVFHESEFDTEPIIKFGVRTSEASSSASRLTVKETGKAV